MKKDQMKISNERYDNAKCLQLEKFNFDNSGHINKKTEFFLPMVPPTVTAQEHRAIAASGKRTIFVDTPELKDAKNKFCAFLAQHMPDAPFEGPLQLITKWCFPRGEHQDGEYKTTKPDTDNLIKAFKDCMAHCGFFENDAQIASEVTEKFWAEHPGIYVCLKEI